MKTNIITLAIIGIFTLGLVNQAVAQNTIYKNVEENKEKGYTTVSLYEGKNDKGLVPLRQYVISYSENGFPKDKIIYEWNSDERKWVETVKYEYFMYDADSRPNMLSYSQWDNKTGEWSDNPKYSVYLYDLDRELLTISK